MSTLKTGAIRGTSGSADSIQIHATNQSVTFPGAVSITGALTASGGGVGKILQVVAGTPDTTFRQTTSTTFVTASSTCNVAITPTSSSSKILVVAYAVFSCNDGNDGWAATIYRDSTNLGVTDTGLAYGNSVAGITAIHYPTTMFYVDSPSTTSSITYQVYIRLHDIDSDAGYARIGHTGYGTSSGDVPPAVMYAMEFA